jgi:hypothetical protein
MTFLERGCDPARTRPPRRVHSIRPLTEREMAELNPFARTLVPVSNLLPLPRRIRRHIYEV